MTNGDVPDGSRARDDGSGGEGDEAAWLGLVARFESPAPAGGDQVPWPERENLGNRAHVAPADAMPDAPTATEGPPALDAPPPTEDLSPPDLLPGEPMPSDALSPEALSSEALSSEAAAPKPDSLPPGERPTGLPGRTWPAARAATGPGTGPRDAPRPDDPADEHYTPPPAPPLPRLAPITVAAWLALVGGPLYLVIATACGWSISGLTAFIAVAAFVGGFAVLVLRMDSGPPRDRGPDDGAVV